MRQSTTRSLHRVAQPGVTQRNLRWPMGVTCAAIVTLASASVSAATYQVGPTRTYQHLGQVSELLQPGDIVELDGDATYPGGVILSRPGSPSQKITIRGIPINGRRPILSGGTNTVEVAANHYVFESLELTAGSFRCFYHHAHDIVVRDARIHDCPAHGILGADSDSGSLLLEHSEVYGCGAGTQHHQIYMATDESTYPGSVFRMEHCYVHDATGGNNVKSRAERNELYFNWIEGALYHEIELIGPDGQDSSLAYEHSEIVGNVLLKRNPFFVSRFGGDGTGETFGRYRFVNNTVVVLPGASAVFRLFDGIDAVEMHNNVFVVNGSGTLNLLREAEASWFSSRAVAGSNNWVQSDAANVPPEWTGTLSGSDPGFINFAGLDLRPAQDSPLVDAGNPNTSSHPDHPFPAPSGPPTSVPVSPDHFADDPQLARPEVGTIDIGAFEYIPPGTGGSGGAAGSAGTGGDGGDAGSSSLGGAAGAGEGGGAGVGGNNSGGSGGTAGGNNAADSGTASGSDSLAAPGEGEDGGCACSSTGSSSIFRPDLLLLIAAGLAGLGRRKLKTSRRTR